ncbi:MAG TPA: acylase [Candidatus Hydrogenedentes bacterium]|nr:acylase [Candidatus Hydrogenedentota bacterium]
MLFRSWVGAISLLAAVALVSCAREEPSLDADKLLERAKQYDVRILRDTWGVPHVFGKTDADTAFGIGFAHSEDDFATIQESLLAGRGELASVKGPKGMPTDLLAAAIRLWDVINAKYETDLSPEIRAVCEAYADGVNLYAAQHPEAMLKPEVFPATGKDVVAGFVLKSPLFFRLDRELKDVLSFKRKHPVSQKNVAEAPNAAQSQSLNQGDAFFARNFCEPCREVVEKETKNTAAREGISLFDVFTRGAEPGSNTAAVAPSRSADGWTRLNINSHQPWTGQVAWYEAHLHSEEGMDIVGGLFPGSPIILHGHNRDLGWAHTVNQPDLTDVYVLEMNPDNPNQYRFDGQWRDLDVRYARIKCRIAGPIQWTFKREVSWSVHGPIIRRPHGVYAIRYAGMGEIRQIEQWYRMGKSRNFEEWQAAVKMRGIASFNMGYADREGNIYYLYNALFPVRQEGYDWKQYLPGDTSETLWTEFIPFEKLPQIKNPAAGFVMNCNNTPFQTTAIGENPKPEDFSPTLGIDTDMTNRAYRYLELLGSDEKISGEEFLEYKFDIAYSDKSDARKLLDELFAMPPSDDPLVREAVDLLKTWDYRTDVDNRVTALAILTLEPIVRARMFGGTEPDRIQLLKERAAMLKEKYGRLDVPWGDINRLVRGNVDIGLSGGPDTLHAVYGNLADGRLVGMAGDCYILVVEWDPDGKVHSGSVHQFGSATMRPESPHYADQAPLFAACKLKPVWLDEADIRANLEKEYRPGQ